MVVVTCTGCFVRQWHCHVSNTFQVDQTQHFLPFIQDIDCPFCKISAAGISRMQALASARGLPISCMSASGSMTKYSTRSSIPVRPSPVGIAPLACATLRTSRSKGHMHCRAAASDSKWSKLQGKEVRRHVDTLRAIFAHMCSKISCEVGRF